jgi:DNA-binding LacI/PurR family transcriptional regulator
MKVDNAEIGQIAATHLLRRLQGDSEPQTTLIQPVLIRGATTASIGRRRRASRANA